MNPDDLAKILDELGQRLGPAGQHVFELAVRQQLIVGWTLLAVFALLAATGLASFGVAVFRARRQPGDQEAGGDAFIFSCFVALLAVIVLIAFLFGGLPRILNPEYAAIRDILSALPGAK